jgi:hypothetical protein
MLVPFRISRSIVAVLVSTTLIALVSSCSSDLPSGPGEKFLAMCHVTAGTGTLLYFRSSEVAERRTQGDYNTELFVDKQSADVGDGVNFARIGDAIASARAVRVAGNEMQTAACPISITVAAGVYRGASATSTDPAFERFPLVLDFPAVKLRGALRMQTDQDHRPIGLGDAAQATTLSPNPGLVDPDKVIVVNGHPDGSVGDGITIEGFAFESGHAGSAIADGQAVFAMRVHDLNVRGNFFGAGFTESVDLRASSAHVDGNYLGGGGGTCDICLSGPGDYEASDNRLYAGGIPGILISATTLLPVPPSVEQYVLPAAAGVTAAITNNEVHDHLRKPVGVGLRVMAVGAGAPNVAGSAVVTFTNNNLVNNNFGILVEGGFPLANTALKGDIDVTLSGNKFSQSCQNNVFVSLARHQTGLGLQNGPYLRNSNYSVKLGGNVAWSDVWYADPDGFGNTLTVDGQLVPNGSRVAYDAARVCGP